MPQPDSRNADAATSELLEAASAYAEAGLHVFPLRPRSKVPATVDGLKAASTDVEQVRAWWQRWPDANVGIRTGAESGVVVLDVDTPKGGAGGLADLECHQGKLAPTARVLTGGGGEHVYLKHPGLELRNSAGRLGGGLDVRGDGGYVVAPPSIHESGRAYRWTRTLDRGLANCPAWLLEDAAERRNGTAEPVDELIPEGKRHQTLLSLAGSMRRRGMSGDEIAAALQAVNERRCRPPLNQTEIGELARDVARRYAPGFATPRVDPDPPSQSHVWDRLVNVERKPIRFNDKPLYQQAAFHELVGIKNAGKGTLIAYEAARVTRGELGDRRSVIWIASGEDSPAIDVRPRLEAAGGDPARVTILRKGRLVLPDHVDELERVARECGDVGLIVLDPLGGSIGAGKSTNADSDVRAALEPLNRLADDLDCMVFGVRHISNKNRERGALASVLGASDWVNVPRVVLAIAHDDEDEDVRHVLVVAGNRVRGGGGRMFRIEEKLLPGMEEPVTVARMLGDSVKDADELLVSKKRESRSSVARDLILDVLREHGRMESDAFDALIAERAHVAAKTVRNLRGDLKNKGWLRAIPERDEVGGEVSRWYVELTNAALAPDPAPDSRAYTKSRAVLVVEPDPSLAPDCPCKEKSGTKPGASRNGVLAREQEGARTLEQALADGDFVQQLIDDGVVANIRSDLA
jgi:hypothetical protein